MTTPLLPLCLAALLALTACNRKPATPPAALQPAPAAALPSGDDARVAAARTLTGRYASSQFSEWNIRAAASGPRCLVLMIDIGMVLDGTMVEALHYGTGPYAVDGSGVQHFYRQQTFRGVAYRDHSQRIWTYGAISENEAALLAPCK